VDITQKIKETILYYLGRGRDGDVGDVGVGNEYVHLELFKAYGELQLGVYSHDDPFLVEDVDGHDSVEDRS
jgi:hypothetical protein